jgi:CHASE1-domain containing sensor protein
VSALNVDNFAWAVPFTPTANFTLTQLALGLMVLGLLGVGFAGRKRRN